MPPNPNFKKQDEQKIAPVTPVEVSHEIPEGYVSIQGDENSAYTIDKDLPGNMYTIPPANDAHFEFPKDSLGRPIRPGIRYVGDTNIFEVVPDNEKK